MDTEHAYDVETGRISNIATGTLGNNSIQDLGYTFDTLGNLTQRVDYNQTSGGADLSEDFVYDVLNRMTSSEVDDGTTLTTKTYSYNAIGNLLTKSDMGSYTYGPSVNSPDAGSHAVTSVIDNNSVNHDFVYDLNGNQTEGYNFTTDSVRTQTWTSYNKVKTITQDTTVLTFSYGADRARFKQINNNGKTTRYIGGLYEKETEGTLTTHLHYIQAGGSVVALYKSKSDTSEQTRYLHRDHIGSVTAITDDTGVVVETLSYDPHGKRRQATWEDAVTQVFSAETTRGFTHHEMLDDVGLIHMNGRVYDPDLGRFISADPHIQEPLNGQSLNRYSYVLNNPLSYTDPSGYFFSSIFKAIKSVVSAVVGAVKSVLNNKVLRTIAAIGIAFIPGGQGFAAAALKGFGAGFVASGGDLKYGIIGAVTGAAFHGIGTHFGEVKAFSSAHIQKIVAHGVVGGTANKAAGGRFLSGFLSAGTAQAFAPGINGLDSGNAGTSLPRTIVAAVVGGTSSVLGGGKFLAGAATGAFSRLFNDEAHSRMLQAAKERIRSSYEGVADEIKFGANAVVKGISEDYANGGVREIFIGATGGRSQNSFWQDALGNFSESSLLFGNIAVDRTVVVGVAGGVAAPQWGGLTIGQWAKTGFAPAAHLATRYQTAVLVGGTTAVQGAVGGFAYEGGNLAGSFIRTSVNRLLR